MTLWHEIACFLSGCSGRLLGADLCPVTVEELGRLDNDRLLLNLPSSERLQLAIDEGASRVATRSNGARSRDVYGLAAHHGMCDTSDDALCLKLRL